MSSSFKRMISFSPGWLREPPAGPDRAALTREELTEVIDLLLRAGAILLENGADSALAERTVLHLGLASGCDELQVLITSSGIIVTTQEGQEFRTKARRVSRMAVHMGKVAGLTALAQRMHTERVSIAEMRAELERVERLGHYPGWLVIATVSLSCGAFSQLFGGHARELLAALLASAAVVSSRRWLLERHFDPILVTVASASLGAGLAHPLCALLGAASAPVISAACVPLVPGVYFVNAARDIIKGHTMMGAARGLRALVLVLSIALGVSLAMGLTGRAP